MQNLDEDTFDDLLAAAIGIQTDETVEDRVALLGLDLRRLAMVTVKE